MKIKNIILDLGGVLIDVDYLKTASAFKRLGLTHFDDLYSQKKQDPFFDNMDKGLISDDAFRSELKKHLPPAVTDTNIDQAWNAMLGRIPVERMDLLRTLKNQYRLFLLSNTNRIHVPRFIEIIEEDHGPRALEGCFEKMYLSCHIHMRKPDAEVFNLVIDENGLPRDETIFIDDSIQHVDGAREAGIPSYFLDLEKNSLSRLMASILPTVDP